MDLLFSNEHATKHVEVASEAQFQKGLEMFNVVADQFVAGDFSLQNAPAGFFELQSVLVSLHQLSKDFDIIARLKSNEEVVETDVEGLMRVKTILEKSVTAFDDEAAKVVKQGALMREMEKEHGLFNAISDHRMDTLKDCLFAGHLATDLDSIAGAIGAAALYNGVPVACSELNSETKFALEKWGFPAPLTVESVITPDSRVCLVDFQQSTQLNSAIDPKQVVGVIDHHALQNATICTNLPIYVDIRPWGSVHPNPNRTVTHC